MGKQWYNSSGERIQGVLVWAEIWKRKTCLIHRLLKIISLDYQEVLLIINMKPVNPNL